MINDTDTVSFDESIEVGITVAEEAEMTPRTPILMVPYAQSLVNLRVYPTLDIVSGPNMIGGSEANSFTAPNIVGASVLSGGSTSVPNTVTGNYGTVAGGSGNTAARHGVVAGGSGNSATSTYATVGGGFENQALGGGTVVAGGTSNSASDTRSTVSGGEANIATGNWSTIGGGRQNGVGEAYAVVGGGLDNTATALSSTIGAAPDVVTGAFIPAGGTGFVGISSKAYKHNFNRIEPVDYLERVAQLDIQEWQMKTEDPSVTHVGPFAEEFYAAFGHGQGERTINTVDADGVALVAIQGLYQLVREQAKTIATLQERLDRLE